MGEPLEGFDLSRFWEDSSYARETYVDVPVTPSLVADIEAALGVRLPASYVRLMKSQNGGIPAKTCFPTAKATSWAEDHVAISGISGIGRGKPHSLCGEAGSEFMQSEWGYPKIGICICDCPSAGHDMVMLDYRECGPEGEPRVVHVDQECDYAITFLATDFESFVRGLVDESVYDTSDDDLKQALAKIDAGEFSGLLREIVEGNTSRPYEPIIRNLCRRLTTEKGHFSLHADPLSFLVYDTLFYLFSSAKGLRSKSAYLEAHPKLIVFGDGAFKTGGYAPGFVEDWITARLAQKDIVMSADGRLLLSAAASKRLQNALDEFAPRA
jgi:hypothetical protein